MLLFNLSLETIRKRISHFNTSNVTIQQISAKRCPEFMWISIHLMLLFNFSCQEKRDGVYYDFNTSNVTIQHNR